MGGTRYHPKMTKEKGNSSYPLNGFKFFTKFKFSVKTYLNVI